MWTRRQMIQSGLGSVGLALLGSRSAFASAPTENRLVLIVLRGGLDGLDALPPFEDRSYKHLRPTLALHPGGDLEGVQSLDGYFGMHPGLAPLQPLYQAGELLFVPAISTRYRTRSHFDGQNLLENGSGTPFGARTGWLNRAILGLNDQDARLGLSIGPAVLLILHGDASVQTWTHSNLSPVDEEFLARLMNAYQADARFLDSLHDAQGALKPELDMTASEGQPRRRTEFTLAAHAAADLLSQTKGPRIAVMEMTGWDTHFAQQRRLMPLLGVLSSGLLELKSGLGTHWDKTTVVVVSEFGRTAGENGNRGTDHGTGGLSLIAGGAVRGGQITGTWPGLSNKALLDERDVRPANSYEALFKTLLIGHLGLDPGFVEDKVFPNSRAFAPMDGLLG